MKNNHLELGIQESAQADETNFCRWVRKVERILGFDLDGNQADDGYSLDYARDDFCQGATAEQHAEHVRYVKKCMSLV